MRKLTTTIQLPLEIPSDRIGLPTGGATITNCTLFHAGEKDSRLFANYFGLSFPVDVYKYEGVIHPVDPEALDSRIDTDRFYFTGLFP